MSSNRRIEERLARRGGSVELLRLPAAVFGAVSGLRGALYDRGWLPCERVEAPVISVGNLTAGGTGKTPMVAFLVRALARRGLRPGIVSRGYRRQAAEESDEARVLAAVVADVPHVLDPDRVRGARALLPDCDVIVLDDGFQHRRLARDLDLVLVDATRPFGLPCPEGRAARHAVRALLPRGLLRERPEALRRAQAAVLTRVDQVAAPALEELATELRRLAPAVPHILAIHRPVRLAGFGGLANAELSELRGRAVVLASGLGNPAAFETSVRALGAEIRAHRRFPDHHAFEPREAAELAAQATRAGAWLVTSAKDAVKLAPLGCAGRSLEIELELVGGAPVLEALLAALPVARARRERDSLHAGLHG